jgi:hypothetical protein
LALTAGLLTEDQDKPFTKRRHLEMGCLRQQQGLREERQLALASELKRVLKLQVARDYKRQQLVTMGLPGGQQGRRGGGGMTGHACDAHHSCWSILEAGALGALPTLQGVEAPAVHLLRFSQEDAPAGLC